MGIFSPAVVAQFAKRCVLFSHLRLTIQYSFDDVFDVFACGTVKTFLQDLIVIAE